MPSILVLDPTDTFSASRMDGLGTLGARVQRCTRVVDAEAALAQTPADVFVVYDPPHGMPLGKFLRSCLPPGLVQRPSVIVVTGGEQSRDITAVADLVLPRRAKDEVFLRAVKLVLQGRADTRPARPVTRAATTIEPRTPVLRQLPADPDKTIVARVRKPEAPAMPAAASAPLPTAARVPTAENAKPATATTYVNGYRVQRILGRGGMSVVYLAHHEASGEDRVLKVLPISEHDGGVLVQRLINEAALLSQISHPGVIKVHEHGFTDWHVYLAMEYLPGGDLRNVLGRPMTPAVAIEAIVQIAGALEAVHAAGMIHRDLKPENVLRRADGTYVLTDFGIARQSGVQLSYVGTGHVMGTAAYLAPELVTGGIPDARTDLYSLGVLLYEMLTGRKPYDGDDPVAVLQLHLSAPLPKLPPTLAWAQCFIDRTMAKRPEHRFGSVAEMVTAVLEMVSALQQEPVSRSVVAG